MRLDWRREDWGYAGATMVAAVLIGYIVAGNFGLVRSPFSPAQIDGSSVEIPRLAASSQQAQDGIPADPTSTGGGTPSVPAPTAPTRDLVPPTAHIDTPGGTSLSLTQGAEVSGSAADEGSGVDRVVVHFEPTVGTPTTVAAVVTCDGRARRSCTWTASVPDAAGSYTISARVTDIAGNAGMSGSKEITVVNVGGILEDLTDGLTGTLDGVGRALLG